jgi:fatty acid desaturase
VNKYVLNNGRSSNLTSSVMRRAAAILLAYGLLVTLALKAWPKWTVIVPLLGCAFILSGFLNAAHDCIHNTHLPRRRLNRVVGAAWCTPILVNFTIYRCQHLVHHRYTGVQGDTEGHSSFASAGAYLFEHTGWNFWRGIGVRIIKTLQREFPRSINNQHKVAGAVLDNSVICMWLTGIGVLTIFFPTIVVVAYWLPLLVYPFFALVLSLPEHYGLRGDKYEGPRSRNVMSNPLVRFFQWNANFHADHHRATHIPAISLEKFHRREGMASREQTEHSYLKFHWGVFRELIAVRTISIGRNRSP